MPGEIGPEPIPDSPVEIPAQDPDLGAPAPEADTKPKRRGWWSLAGK